MEPLFTPTPDGANYNVSPPGVLLLLARTFYSDASESTPAGRARARAVLDAMLAAARAGGFEKTDILETLLARNVATKRVGEMAAEACAAAGDAAIREIFDSMRKG